MNRVKSIGRFFTQLGILSFVSSKVTHSALTYRAIILRMMGIL